jgi:1,4-dihydroxy-2-naphthoate octaprenyltransferase
MLANNICDIEDDIENKRYTLPIYIGKNNALIVFRALYYIGYLSLIILLLFKVIPLLAALSLVTVIFVNRNINLFYQRQTKEDTFIFAVKNFVLMNVTLVLSIAISKIINIIF